MSFACSSPAGGMLFGVSGLLLLLLLLLGSIHTDKLFTTYYHYHYHYGTTIIIQINSIIQIIYSSVRSVDGLYSLISFRHSATSKLVTPTFFDPNIPSHPAPMHPSTPRSTPRPSSHGHRAWAWAWAWYHLRGRWAWAWALGVGVGWGLQVCHLATAATSETASELVHPSFTPLMCR